ncbi:16S rRNA (cytosine967-C5)-methyltransferase [Glycomyces harbinensis]|uniref:16S rRNA (Cytosine967-C5)-methyltransferase n=2 Tax=Glycomyces harbinensis TaxID=58114 RepID=A0A1G6WQ27_9ACTN|nr:transcription antitermination factor NusB [Glycomyces harbinensis]SDD67982.1 16S rRNA (cytosine967-C5)-methyltransferase [Glycomyces harbinensis]
MSDRRRSRRREPENDRPNVNPRRVAFDAIRAVTEDNAYANLVLPRMLAETDNTGRDAGLATELTYGTLRSLGTLEAILAAASGRHIRQLQQDLVDALCLGAYQLLYMRIPPHAAVATTVSLVKAAVSPRVSGLANAVLRKVAAKDLDEWTAELATGDRLADLSLRYAHPEWITAEFEAVVGPDELPAALEADNVAPPVHLCAKPGRITKGDLSRETRGGLHGQWSPYAVYLPGGDPGRIRAVATGLAHVQDEGSQLVAVALAEAPLEGRDEAWLDLCAGPGGKTGLLGAIAAGRGAAVDAVEIQPHRAELVAKAAKGLPVTVHTGDGREFGEAGSFDRVLVDAPCSGLGALRRRPEARWRKQRSDIDGLVPLQKELLASGLRLARPGGIVAYVTCSPVIAETEEVVASALKTPGTELVRSQWLADRVPDSARGDFVQLWPHRHGTDAMFLALIRKTA